MPSYIVKRDGTRIPFTPLNAEARKAAAPKITFADRVSNANYALAMLGLHDHVLLRMDRRLATGKPGYKRYGA